MNKQKPVIEWAKGTRSSVPAPDVWSEITAIEDRDGYVTPAAMVDRARPDDSVMHPLFTWDDFEAAEKYRREEARSIKRKLVVRPAKAPELKTRALEVVTIDATDDQPPKRVYKSVERIMEDPGERAELLARAINEAIAFRRRYSVLSELAGVFAALDQFLMSASDVIENTG